MIPCKDGDERIVDMRMSALPTSQESGDFFEPTERAGGLRELRIAPACLGRRIFVRLRHLTDKGTNVVKGVGFGNHKTASREAERATAIVDIGPGAKCERCGAAGPERKISGVDWTN